MSELEKKIEDQIEVTNFYMHKGAEVYDSLYHVNKLVGLFFEYLKEYKSTLGKKPCKKTNRKSPSKSVKPTK